MNVRLHISVALLSLALIAFQLLLMQVLSIVQWYHFAYMVISVALLGFGASGTTLALARGWLSRRGDVITPLLMMLSGAAMASAVWICQRDFVRFDSYLLFVDRSQVNRLVLTYGAMFVPFFLGAVALGVIFVGHVGKIGSVYFANLLGSGMGGVVAVLLLWWLPAARGTSVMAMVSILAGFLLAVHRRGVRLTLAGVLCFILALYVFLVPPRLIPSEYKSLSRTLNLPGARVLLERSSPYGFVQVVSAPSLRYAPGLSLTYQQPVPVHEAAFSNGDWIGPLVGWSRSDTVHMLDYTTYGLPYAMRPRGRVLVLQSGTGVHVAHAITRRVQHVVAVESNRTVLSILLNECAALTDSLLFHPAVQVSSLDPRVFLSSDTSAYDLVLLPMLDAFGGTSGLYALQEQYVLTREAIRGAFDRLTNEGVICVTSWMDHPARNPLKALATIVAALRDAGIREPSRHIVAVRSWGTMTFAAKKSFLTADEIQAIRAFSDRMLFDPALLPGLDPLERTRYNQTGDSTFFKNLDDILLTNGPRVFQEYSFNIRPATDDRPYFSQFVQWSSILRLRELFGDHAFPFLELGTLIVAVTFLQIVAVAFVLIIAPLFGLPRGGRKAGVVVYFGALGIGYMFVEMVLIQRFVLYFGQTVFAVSAVFAALLISSGIGSLVSARVPAAAPVLRRVLGGIACLIVLYAVVLTPLLHASGTLPNAWKGVLSFLLILPLGFVMGIPFPVGLRSLSIRGERHLAWAWGINGCASVISTAMATMIAVYQGFFVVMISAAIAYSVAAAVSALGSARPGNVVGFD